MKRSSIAGPSQAHCSLTTRSAVTPFFSAVISLQIFVSAMLGAVPAGRLDWLRLSDTGANQLEQVSAIALGSDNRIYGVGSGSSSNWEFDSSKFDTMTFGFTPSGIRLWKQLYDGIAQDYDAGVGIATGADGKVFVFAESTSIGGLAGDAGRDFVTLCYSPSGSTLWTRFYTGAPSRYDSPRVIAADRNGQVYVAGTSASGTLASSPFAGVIVSYSGEGLPLWTNRFLAPGSLDAYPTALEADSNGRLFATFYLGHRSLSAVDTMVLCYSNSGALLWNRRVGAVGKYNPPGGLALAPSGDVYAAKTGYTADDSQVYAFSPEGVIRWSRKYRGVIRAIVADRNDNVVVGGVGENSDGSLGTWQLVSFSSKGSPQWTNTMANGYYSFLTSMETDSNNNIFATGINLQSNQDQISRLQVAAYAADGATLWAYSQDLESRSGGIAVDRAGNSYVGASLKVDGAYRAGLLRFSPYLFVAPPSSPPRIPVGADATLRVQVNGAGPIGYQWYFSDVALPGATSTNLAIANAQIEQQGSYYLVASNSFRVQTSDIVNLTVIGPPSITVDPPSLVVGCGRTAQLTTTAMGVPPFTYQWRVHGTNLPNETNATLTLPAAAQDSGGLYQAVVRAFGLSATSAPSLLTVDTQVAPTIVRSSSSLLTNVHSRVELWVDARSCSTASFQWYFEGAAILGATGPSLFIPSVDRSDAGLYHVQVCNEFGCVTNIPVRLEINRRPIAGNVGGIALRNQPLVIPATQLLSKATDQDGDPLAISSVSPESFWGNPVRLAGTNVVYSPLAGFVGSDEFAFAVSDGRGGRTTAFFEAFVLDEPALLPNKVSIGFMPAGLRLRYLGLPGQHCWLQRSDSVSPADWRNVKEFAVPTHGVWEFVDQKSDSTFFLRILCR